MNELALTGISLLIFILAAFGSVGVLVSRRVAEPEPEPEPEPVTVPRAKRYRRRLTVREREAERALVLAGLLAGIEPVLIARLLCHSLAHNRRIVTTVYRLNKHRLEPLLLPQSQRKPILEAV